MANQSNNQGQNKLSGAASKMRSGSPEERSQAASQLGQAGGRSRSNNTHR